MKKTRLIVPATALAAFGIFCLSSLGSCKKDNKICPVLYTGSGCTDQIRNAYAGAYVGSGVDNFGNNYNNWQFKFTATGSNANHMTLVISNGSITPTELGITLTSDNSFIIEPNATQTHQYSGNGVITGSVLSISWTHNSTPANGQNSSVNYTFSNAARQ